MTCDHKFKIDEMHINYCIRCKRCKLSITEQELADLKFEIRQKRREQK